MFLQATPQETSKTKKEHLHIVIVQTEKGIIIIIKGFTEQRKTGMETGVSKQTSSHILHSQHPPSFSRLSPLSPFFYCKIMAMFLHNFPLFFMLVHRESVCGGEWNSLVYVASFSLDI